MSKYAANHTSALATVSRKGAAVTFSRLVPGTYDPATDTTSAPTTETVTGSAVEDEGDTEVYQALGLTASEVATLFFIPTTYGAKPSLGASVTWGGDTYTVRKRESFAPDGTILGVYVVIAR